MDQPVNGSPVPLERVKAARLLKRLNDADGLPTDARTLRIANTPADRIAYAPRPAT